jgi:pyridine nucleotide-disulfide oxidoreductase family protein
MVSVKNPVMKHLILVGGGHAHVYILKQLQHQQRPDTRITLISPDRYQYYSGMFSGYMEGMYGLDDIRIDLIKLCNQANVDFIVASAKSLDHKKQEILISKDERIRYDWISFNIGSRIAHDTIPGLDEANALIKPNFRVPKIKDALTAKERIVVVGGGASGIEMSLSLQANRNRKNMNTPVTLVHSGRLLESYGTRTSRHITDIVQNKGVSLIQNDPVISVHENDLLLKSGSRIPIDGLLWLTGPSAPRIFQESGLRTDAQGYLLVNVHLQSVFYPNIFGAGDCIGMEAHPNLRKAGVYAVREAPILWFNLQRYMDGGALRRYRPQSAYLSILSTGNEEALLLYRGLIFHGRWCWKLKRRIDTSFIRKYQF